jgi:hypothetical protein
MSALREHFANHPFHLVGCGAAVLLVVIAAVFSVPVFAIFGALMCGAMMIGMVWMMIAMGSKGGGH